MLMSYIFSGQVFKRNIINSFIGDHVTFVMFYLFIYLLPEIELCFPGRHLRLQAVSLAMKYIFHLV